MFNLQLRKPAAVRIVQDSLRSTFTDVEIASMARLGTITHVASGDDLMAEGTDGTHAFFITTGSAAVRRGSDLIAMLSPGDLVGERALVTHEPRNATVTALMPVTALAFDRQQFNWLRLESPKVKALCDDLIAERSA